MPIHVELIVRPEVPPLSWAEFLELAPAYSIAIDGFVAEAPCFDPQGPHANFNHHEGVDRLATRATCGQILIAIRQGLLETFRLNGYPHFNVYVNDCDEDVCLSWWLLDHAHIVEQSYNPLLNRLVGMEDMMDATAGAYPFHRDMPALAELAWVFAPYRTFRKNGGLDKRVADDFRAVIEMVGTNIDRYLVGKGGTVSLDTTYRRTGGGNGWVMIDEAQSGEHARTGMFSDGIRAYVSWRERPDGRFVYTIGRMSQFIPFPVPELLQRLDVAEGNSEEHWGGGNTIGGSPRTAGSRLTPDEVAVIIGN